MTCVFRDSPTFVVQTTFVYDWWNTWTIYNNTQIGDLHTHKCCTTPEVVIQVLYNTSWETGLHVEKSKETHISVACNLNLLDMMPESKKSSRNDEATKLCCADDQTDWMSLQYRCLSFIWVTMSLHDFFHWWWHSALPSHPFLISGHMTT